MLPALLFALAGASASAPAAPPAPAGDAPTVDMVPPFIGACMSQGPDAAKIRAVVLKAGGKPAPKPAGKLPGDTLEAYLFENSGAPYSVIFDKAGTCSVVSGRADLEVTRASLDRLVIGSSKVFDISQTEAKPHAPGETVAVEYRLASKNNKGGLLLTLSRVTREGKVASFLTRRVYSAGK